MVDVKGGRFSDPTTWKQYDLTSQVDGIVDMFTTPVAYTSTKILVFLNGIERIGGIGKDYIEVSDTQFQFSYVPEAWEKLEVWLIKK